MANFTKGNDTVTNCHGLKMQAADNNMRMTVAAAARQKLELESGKKVVSKLNAKNLKSIE